MAGESLPYGLRDVKVATLEADGTRGTLVDLPNGRTFSFSEEEEFAELRGDDKVVAKRGQGPNVEWELESGGISLEAYAIMNGGEVTTSGTAPNEVKTYKKKATDARPDFWVEGQAISEGGGDFHVVLYRCKADGGIEGELSDGEFWLTSASGSCLPSRAAANEDDIYDFVQNPTETAIA